MPTAEVAHEPERTQLGLGDRQSSQDRNGCTGRTGGCPVGSAITRRETCVAVPRRAGERRRGVRISVVRDDRSPHLPERADGAARREGARRVGTGARRSRPAGRRKVAVVHLPIPRGSRGVPREGSSMDASPEVHRGERHYPQCRLTVRWPAIAGPRPDWTPIGPAAGVGFLSGRYRPHAERGIGVRSRAYRSGVSLVVRDQGNQQGRDYRTVVSRTRARRLSGETARVETPTLSNFETSELRHIRTSEVRFYGGAS